MKLLESIQQLYNNELYEEVIFIYNMSSEKDTLTGKNEALVQVYLADSYFYTESYCQAKRIYYHALTLYKSIPKITSKHVNEAEVKFRLHKCLLKLNKLNEAIGVLGSIQPNVSTLKVKYAMAKLLVIERNSHSDTSLQNLKDLYEECPYAYGTLAELLKNGVEPENAVCSDEGMKSYLDAQAASFQDPAEAVAALSQLQHAHTTPAILVDIGLLYNRIGMRSEARAALWKAFTLDNDTIRAMDVLASLLTREERLKDLEPLAIHMMKRNQNAVESWIAFGYLAKYQHSYDRALHFAYKATTMNFTASSEAMLLKAKVLTDKGNLDESVKHLHEIISHDATYFDAYEELCSTYLKNDQAKEATNIVRQCNKVLVNSPRPKILLAKIYLHDNTVSKEAENILENVIHNHPYLTDAIFFLLQVYKDSNKTEKGISLLQKLTESSALECSENSRLHQMLGDFLAKARRPTEAHSSLNRALACSSNPGEINSINMSMNALNSALQCSATPENVLPTVTPAAPNRRRRYQSPDGSGRDLPSRLTFS